MGEDWVLLNSISVDLHDDQPQNYFKKILNLWWDNCHIINRRISSGIRLKNADKTTLISDLKLEIREEDVEICKFVPKSSIYSKKSYEICRFEAHRTHTICSWIKNSALDKLNRWLRRVAPNSDIHSHALIDAESYSETYERIKNAYGKELVSKWTEKTDPQKFVFEDCAIVSYLIELWKRSGMPKQFVDVGCGNGLLTYLLSKEKINGIGIDIRKRNIWDEFKAVADLREVVLDPSSQNTGIPSGSDFLIGNHSDELTPWIPLMAARLNCGFFLLPCCPFDLFGKFSRRNIKDCVPIAKNLGSFGQYFSYVHEIIAKLGFDVKMDRLKIPSTKRLCFVATIRDGGLPEDIEERIAEIISSARNLTKSFVPRPSIDPVKNCSQMPLEERTNLTKRIFSHLLSLSTAKDIEWRFGGSDKLANIMNILTSEEKTYLKLQNGGLQTFIRNQHQIFTVINGCVQIRNWVDENEKFLLKKKDLRKSKCWFYYNHPDGCPFTQETCAFKHE